MSHFFAFESELERSLQCIPMVVRLKLDRCGVKLSLSKWNRFPEGNRRNLLQAPCKDPVEVARYREALCQLLHDTVGRAPQLMPVAERRPWDDADIPCRVVDKTLEMGLNALTPAQWRGLSTLQRFALVKLARAARDNRNFAPALREFGLL